MELIEYSSIVKLPFSKNAIIRKDFPGFQEDYLVIHCLIKKYKPERFMEIGTSTGLGTNVICNAMEINRYWFNKKKVFSIDVPPNTDPDVIYPEKEDGHPKIAGALCKYPYTQLFGNSQEFKFSKYYPLDGWFIDGKHSYQYCINDTKAALLSNPKIIIWHDVQIDGVKSAIVESIKNNLEYNLFLVKDTRIAYSIRDDVYFEELRKRR
jgi:hypothetical protein